MSVTTQPSSSTAPAFTNNVFEECKILIKEMKAHRHYDASNHSSNNNNANEKCGAILERIQILLRRHFLVRTTPETPVSELVNCCQLFTQAFDSCLHVSALVARYTDVKLCIRYLVRMVETLTLLYYSPNNNSVEPSNANKKRKLSSTVSSFSSSSSSQPPVLSLSSLPSFPAPSQQQQQQQKNTLEVFKKYEEAELQREVVLHSIRSFWEIVINQPSLSPFSSELGLIFAEVSSTIIGKQHQQQLEKHELVGFLQSCFSACRFVGGGLPCVVFSVLYSPSRNGGEPLTLETFHAICAHLESKKAVKNLVKSLDYLRALVLLMEKSPIHSVASTGLRAIMIFFSNFVKGKISFEAVLTPFLEKQFATVLLRSASLFHEAKGDGGSLIARIFLDCFVGYFTNKNQTGKRLPCFENSLLQVTQKFCENDLKFFLHVSKALFPESAEEGGKSTDISFYVESLGSLLAVIHRKIPEANELVSLMMTDLYGKPSAVTSSEREHPRSNGDGNGSPPSQYDIFSESQEENRQRRALPHKRLVFNDSSFKTAYQNDVLRPLLRLGLNKATPLHAGYLVLALLTLRSHHGQLVSDRDVLFFDPFLSGLCDWLETQVRDEEEAAVFLLDDSSVLLSTALALLCEVLPRDSKHIARVAPIAAKVCDLAFACFPSCAEPTQRGLLRACCLGVNRRDLSAAQRGGFVRLISHVLQLGNVKAALEFLVEEVPQVVLNSYARSGGESVEDASWQAQVLDGFASVLETCPLVGVASLERACRDARNEKALGELLPLWVKTNRVIFNEEAEESVRLRLLSCFICVFRQLDKKHHSFYEYVDSASMARLFGLIECGNAKLRNAACANFDLFFVRDKDTSRMLLLDVLFEGSGKKSDVVARSFKEDFDRRFSKLGGRDAAPFRRSLLIAFGVLGSTVEIGEVHRAQLKDESDYNIGLSLLQWCLYKLSIEFLRGEALPSLLATVTHELQTIAKKRNFPSVYHMFEREEIKKDLYPVLFREMLGDKLKTSNLLRFVNGVFEGEGVTPDKFLQAALPVLLPYFLRAQDEPMLRELAKVRYPTNGALANAPPPTALVQRLLMDSARCWVFTLVELYAERDEGVEGNASLLDMNQTKGARLFKFLQPILKMSESDLFVMGKKRILETVAIKLYSEKRLCETCLKILGYFIGDDQAPHKATLLQSEFMFLMSTLSERVHDLQLGQRERKGALRSIEMLLQLHENAFSDAHVAKVMPTLKSVWPEPELQYNALLALRVLVTKMSAHCLPSNVCDIVASLLPCFMPAAVHAALGGTGAVSSGNAKKTQQLAFDLVNGLVCDQTPARRLSRELLLEIRTLLLLFIKKNPSEDAGRKLNDVVAKLPSPDRRGVTEKVATIQAVMVKHSSDFVRYYALTALYDYCRAEWREELSELLLQGKPEARACVSSLLRTLFECARTATNRTIRLLVCDCLGELGAIDAVKLEPVAVERVRDDGGGGLDLGNEELAKALVSRFLVKMLKNASDPNKHMVIGLTIQEMLCFLKEEVYRTPDALDLEAIFPDPEICEFVRPFMSTNYHIVDPSVASTKPLGRGGRTFFGPELAFSQSMGDWATHLILRGGVQSVQARLFHALRMVRFFGDASLELWKFLLPYLVQNAIICGGDAVFQSIREELTSILNDAVGCSPSVVNPPSASSASTGESFSAASSAEEAARVQLSTIAVLNLLETLTRWEARSRARARKPPTSGKSAYRGDFKDKSKLHALLQCFSNDLLSDAALKCGASARALMLFERHLREMYSFDELGGGIAPGAWHGSVQFERAEIEFLLKVYSSVDEPDGIDGVASVRSRHDGGRGVGNRRKGEAGSPGASPANRVLNRQVTRMEQIAELEHFARWDEALLCYEEAIDAQEGDVKRLCEGQLRCLWNAGHYELLVSLGGKLDQAWLHPVLLPYKIDALWRLARWGDLHDQLSAYAARAETRSAVLSAPGGVSAQYTLKLAASLLGVARKDARAVVEAHVQEGQLEVLNLLSSREDYAQAYPYLFRLHIFREIGKHLEERAPSSGSLASPTVKKPRFEEESEPWWDNRIRMCEFAPFALVNELVSVRRVLFRDEHARKLELDTWLHVSNSARIAGHLRGCEFALSMLRRSCPAAPLQHVYETNLWEIKTHIAELLREKGALHEALQAMEPSEFLRADFRSARGSRALGWAKAKALLLATNVSVEAGLIHGSAVLDRYQLVLQLKPNCEQGLFHYAKYLDDLYHKTPRNWSLLHRVVKSYIEALKHGSGAHLFETFPRILTIWFAHGDYVHSLGEVRKAAAEGSADAALEMINLEVRDMVKEIPTSTWYTSLAQLISHLCHPVEGVWKVTSAAVGKILSTYPSRALWQIMGVAQSKIAMRKFRAMEILNAFRDKSEANADLIRAVQVMFKELIELAPGSSNATPEAIQRLRSAVQAVRKCSQGSKLGLVLPTQAYLDCQLESSRLLGDAGQQVEVLRSKIRPKKVQLSGTDGVARGFLLKMDESSDLRKDLRLMEFANLVNQLFQRDTEARRRSLKLRTYAVVCLNEECGIMEWVENTRGLRAILVEVYEKENLARGESTKLFDASRTALETLQGKTSLSKAERVAEFQAICARFPPRFHKWFLAEFAEPEKWLAARACFTRSAATWSMCGHILGLGDRHLENILMDTTTGECVHVDFDCLFDKGLSLKVPEIVPFRLTHNMVDAMGVLGYEGPFRRCCEVSLQVLRTNKGMLLSLLESFVVDPLVEWWKKAAGNQKEGGAKKENDGKSRLDAIEKRLSGIVRDREDLSLEFKFGKAVLVPPPPPLANRTNHSAAVVVEEEKIMGFDALPLNTQGQVQRLIDEAIDQDKLSRMFAGWLPFV